MDRPTQKCSTIMISVGDKTKVYHSVEEIPPELREKLIESTHGINSATILIADKRGREEILRAIQASQSSRYSRLAGSLLARRLASVRPKPRFRLTWASLGRILLLVCFAYLLWVLASSSW